MKFEISVALSYILPRKGRLSQSVTALFATLVISTIVWLTLVYFSTIGSIEERWVEKIESILGTYELVPTSAYLQAPSSEIAQQQARYSYSTPRLSLQAQESVPVWDEEQDGPLAPHLLGALQTKTPLARLIELLKPYSWSLFEQQVAHVQCGGEGDKISQYVILRGMQINTALNLMQTNQLDSEEAKALLSFLSEQKPHDRPLPLHIEVNCPQKRLLTLWQNAKGELFFQEKEHIFSFQDILSRGTSFSILSQEPCLLTSKALLPTRNRGYPLLLPIQARKQHIRILDPILIEPAQNGSINALSSLKGFVAGFYDPGILPMGSKLFLCSTEVITQLSSSLVIEEPLSSSGIALYTTDKTNKKELLSLLREYKLDSFFTLHSYEESPMTHELFLQLKNEKILFQLLSSILLFVASSNILSMLFIIARDRKREIALFRALGMKRWRIVFLFSFAGFFTGLLSLFIGYLLAQGTLHFLPECLSLLSWLQGHSILDPALFGAMGRESVRENCLLFSSFFVLISATLAGLGASLYATKISISEALKEP